MFVKLCDKTLQTEESEVDLLRKSAGNVLWLANNMHNYGGDQWRELFFAAVRDARAALAKPEEPS